MVDSEQCTAPPRPAECDYPTAASIEAILVMARRPGTVTVNDCIGELGDNSIPLALLLFTLLSSLPLFSIPGFTTITGIPIVLLGGQLMCGREAIWLPRRIRQRKLTSRRLWALLEKTLPKLYKVENYLKPRILSLSATPLRQFIGFAFVIMGILLALPIPFINFPAGFSMFLLAVGLVERDGVVISAGLLAISILSVVMVVTFNTLVALAGG